MFRLAFVGSLLGLSSALSRSFLTKDQKDDLGTWLFDPDDVFGAAKTGKDAYARAVWEHCTDNVSGSLWYTLDKKIQTDWKKAVNTATAPGGPLSAAERKATLDAVGTANKNRHGGGIDGIHRMGISSCEMYIEEMTTVKSQFDFDTTITGRAKQIWTYCTNREPEAKNRYMAMLNHAKRSGGILSTPTKHARQLSIVGFFFKARGIDSSKAFGQYLTEGACDEYFSALTSDGKSIPIFDISETLGYYSYSTGRGMYSRAVWDHCTKKSEEKRNEWVDALNIATLSGGALHSQGDRDKRLNELADWFLDTLGFGRSYWYVARMSERNCDSYLELLAAPKGKYIWSGLWNTYTQPNFDEDEIFGEFDGNKYSRFIWQQCSTLSVTKREEYVKMVNAATKTTGTGTKLLTPSKRVDTLDKAAVIFQNKGFKKSDDILKKMKASQCDEYMNLVAVKSLIPVVEVKPPVKPASTVPPSTEPVEPMDCCAMCMVILIVIVVIIVGAAIAVCKFMMGCGPSAAQLLNNNNNNSNNYVQPAVRQPVYQVQSQPVYQAVDCRGANTVCEDGNACSDDDGNDL